VLNARALCNRKRSFIKLFDRVLLAQNLLSDLEL
jgi:hypothetical protein